MTSASWAWGCPCQGPWHIPWALGSLWITGYRVSHSRLILALASCVTLVRHLSLTFLAVSPVCFPNWGRKVLVEVCHCAGLSTINQSETWHLLVKHLLYQSSSDVGVCVCVCLYVLAMTEAVTERNGDGVMVVVTVLVIEAQWQYLAAGRTECVHRNDDMLFISQPMQLWRKRDSQMLLGIQALS